MMLLVGGCGRISGIASYAHVSPCKGIFHVTFGYVGGVGGGAGVGGGGGGGGVDNVRWYCFPITLLSTLGRLQFEERNAHH